MNNTPGQIRKPNILLLFTDQHRLSAVGAYGSTPCLTPNIDGLASEGVRFENVYTTCPVCTPARASIITGQLPHNHGMVQNIEDKYTPVHELSDGPNLLSRQLQRAGYKLGYTGKWHLGSKYTKKLNAPICPCLPKDVGFEGHNFPGHGNGGWNFPEFRNYLKLRGLEHKVKPWLESTTPYRAQEYGGILEQSLEGTVPYYLAENTIDMIDHITNDGRPFFIWHNFWGPHSPYFVIEEYLDLYRNEEIPEWPNYRWPAREIQGPHQFSITPQLLWLGKDLKWEDWAMAIRYYYAFTTLIDGQIGRIIDHLRQRKILENTVVVFTADHGESLGDHGGIYNKGWTHFEETHRIPLIIKMPDAHASNRVVKELVSLADIYPTIMEMAGLQSYTLPPAAVPADYPYNTAVRPDGMSLMPLIRGNQVKWRKLVVSEFHGLYDNMCMMRTCRCGKYKYGYTFLGRDELYDLEQDPYEMNNLIDEPRYSDVLENLRMHLWEHMEQTNDSAAFGFHFTRLGGRKMETKAPLCQE